uniref:Fetuin B n=2 Tax=Rhinolophus ferrumequinum TaxID=59479 RepID=A0A671FV94_RHIFE
TTCIYSFFLFLPVGICKGFLSKRGLEKFVDVSCNFFESQELGRILTVEEPQQKNTDLTDSPSKVAPKGSVQHLPALEGEQPEDSKGKGPVEAFPVQVDLTTNPQGETLDVSFLFLGPMKEQLVVLPFPKEEQRSVKCPAAAKVADPPVLPP